MNKNELIKTRAYKPEDRNFILATFLRGLFYGDSWFTIIPKHIFMEHYHKVIVYLLDKSTTEIKVSCLVEDENVVLGYSITSPDTLHWVFVKKQWRGIGIAKDLVPESIKVVTHLTKVGLSIISRKKLDFNPFAI